MSKVIIRQMLLLTIAGIAVLMDLYEMRIKNSWIICSFIAGLIYSIWSGNRHGIVQFVLGTAVPIVLLGWLFYFRMLGTGDIKLFCVIGGLIGTVSHIMVYVVCGSCRSSTIAGNPVFLRRLPPKISLSGTIHKTTYRNWQTESVLSDRNCF